MRIEQFPNGAWSVKSEVGELSGKIGPRTVGVIATNGRIEIWRPATGAPRTYGREARELLELARRELMRRGDLRDRERERREREEARSGSFIVRMSTGLDRRFNEARRAYDYLETELRENRASSGEVFRAPPKYFDMHRQLRSLREQYPGGWWNPNDAVLTYIAPIGGSYRDAYGNVRTLAVYTSTYRRPYGLKAAAVVLENEDAVSPSDKADQWRIVGDAFSEAGNAYEEDVANDRADYWRRRSAVLSRRVTERRGRRLPKRRRTR